MRSCNSIYYCFCEWGLLELPPYHCLIHHLNVGICNFNLDRSSDQELDNGTCQKPTKKLNKNFKKLFVGLEKRTFCVWSPSGGNTHQMLVMWSSTIRSQRAFGCRTSSGRIQGPFFSVGLIPICRDPSISPIRGTLHWEKASRTQCEQYLSKVYNIKPWELLAKW